MQTQTTLPLDQLRIDTKSNVRKIGRGSTDHDFIASIKAIGIQMPLIVRKNGAGYVVTDGGKRLEAAKALVKSGDIAADALIPVIISEASDAEAREISLALNIVRANMHPVDAFRAFIALHTDKEKPLDVQAIADRFGVDTKTVQQRLALGALHDSILDAWRDGEIKQDVAQAFTLCPNKKEQAKLFADLKANSEKFNTGIWAGGVKTAITGNQQNAGRYLNAVVGAEAYEARGGKVTHDLFGDDHVVSDVPLLQQMVQEKLDETCKALIAAGWKWATANVPQNEWQFGRVQCKSKPTAEEAKRLSDLQTKYEDENLDQEDIDAASEAYDQLDREIQLRGFTDKQMASSGCFVFLAERGRGREGTITIDYGRTEPEKVQMQTVEKDGKSVTTATKQKSKPELTKALSERLNEWRRSALKAALVTAYAKCDPLSQMLVGIVAAQIRPESAFNWAPQEIARRSDQLLEGIDAKLMNAALRKAFDAKAYFDGCGKAFCLAAITEVVNADEARKVSTQKRGEIAKFALVNVGKTAWLPKELRTRHYDGPTGRPRTLRDALDAKKAAKPAAKKTAKKSR